LDFRREWALACIAIDAARHPRESQGNERAYRESDRRGGGKMRHCKRDAVERDEPRREDRPAREPMSQGD
jgi:hypothetical protein